MPYLLLAQKHIALRVLQEVPALKVSQHHRFKYHTLT